MEDERKFLTPEDAAAMLPEGERIHTFRGGSGFMIGADWDRADILKAFEKFSPELAGPSATAMGHGIVIIDPTGPLFIETRRETDGN